MIESGLKIPKVNSIILLYSLTKAATSSIPFQDPILTPCLIPSSAAQPISGLNVGFGKIFNAPTEVSVYLSATEG